MTQAQALPALGAQVYILPAQRTLRDKQRQPICDDAGHAKKCDATVFIAGERITKPTRIKVTIEVLRQLRAGNLQWQSVNEHLERVRRARERERKAKIKAQAKAQAAESESAAKKTRTTKSQEPAA